MKFTIKVSNYTKVVIYFYYYIFILFCFCLFSDHSTIFSRHTQIEPKLINARENAAIENTLDKVKIA